jgi:hypothetical protein
MEDRVKLFEDSVVDTLKVLSGEIFAVKFAGCEVHVGITAILYHKPHHLVVVAKENDVLHVYYKTVSEKLNEDANTLGVNCLDRDVADIEAKFNIKSVNVESVSPVTKVRPLYDRKLPISIHLNGGSIHNMRDIYRRVESGDRIVVYDDFGGMAACLKNVHLKNGHPARSLSGPGTGVEPLIALLLANSALFADTNVDEPSAA